MMKLEPQTANRGQLVPQPRECFLHTICGVLASLFRSGGNNVH